MPLSVCFKHRRWQVSNEFTSAAAGRRASFRAVKWQEWVKANGGPMVNLPARRTSG